MDDELLDTDAVLTSVLAELDSVKCATVRGMVENIQDATHPDADVSVQVSTRQDDSWVLSSKFQSQRSHVLRSSERNLATDFFRSDKRDVFYDRRFCQNLSLGGETTHELKRVQRVPPSGRRTTHLDKLGVESAGPQALFDGTNEPQGGPDNVFRTLQDDGVSSKQGSDNR